MEIPVIRELRSWCTQGQKAITITPAKSAKPTPVSEFILRNQSDLHLKVTNCILRSMNGQLRIHVLFGMLMYSDKIYLNSYSSVLADIPGHPRNIKVISISSLVLLFTRRLFLKVIKPFWMIRSDLRWIESLILQRRVWMYLLLMTRTVGVGFILDPLLMRRLPVDSILADSCMMAANQHKCMYTVYKYRKYG